MNIFYFYLVTMEMRALNRILIFSWLFFFFFFSFSFLFIHFCRNLFVFAYIRCSFFTLACIAFNVCFLHHPKSFCSPTRTCWTAASQTSITLGNKLRSKRSQGEFTESSQMICERFSNPLPNNTFFSPIDTTMLSDTYPPKVDCILKITG